MTVDYHAVIRDSRSELSELLKARDSVETRITQIILALKGLSRFLPQTEREQLLQELRSARRKAPSLTDSISTMLQSFPNGLKSGEIRDRLEESGFDLDQYSQPLGTIMTTLQRLVDSGKVKRDLSAKDGGGVTYRWKRSPEDVAFEQRMAEGKEAIERSSAFKKGLLDKK